ncbi:hypothetical protein Z968_06485 [Clostridium novyi A str. 4552]|uniref:Uncharacterized protein n=1 Tax=Clostridium novyi A str. 4552 TaxID=1444289 RepID=A0A0A0I771_CLONO|nr:hypothetical protein [Clostridium novyi]KGM96448.1 hypothetical protein Z968_06485 [Clostridium novyi A str. 4552]
MILVDNSHKYRDYGSKDIPSEIYGDVTIYGNLREGEEINIYNLNVHGIFIIDIGEGHINIYNSNFNKILTLSAGFNTVEVWDDSIINNLCFQLKKPTHFKVCGNKVMVNNIMLNNLEYNNVKFSGNLKNTKIIKQKTPLLLPVTDYDEVKHELILYKENRFSKQFYDENISHIDVKIVKEENKVLRALKKFIKVFNK